MARIESLRAENKFKKTEVGEIPVDWGVVQLGSVADITKLAGFEYTKHFDSYKGGGEIIVIRGANIKDDKLDFADVKSISAKISNGLKRSKLYKNNLVFSYVGTIGPIALIEEDNKYHLGPNTSKIIPNESALIPKYLYHLFRSKIMENEIKKYISVGAQPSLSMEKIRKFRIILPSTISEQKKIAQILSTADTAIEKNKKIIEKEKHLKKGLMQELLTRGIGHKKFKKTKIGEIPEKWKCDALERFVSISSGEACKYSRSPIELPYPVYGSNGIMGSYGKFNFEDGFVIGRVGASGSLQMISNKIWATDNTLLMSIDSSKVKKDYLFYYLQRCKLPELATKTAQPLLTQKVLRVVNIAIPPISEQKQVAEILSSVDDKIDREQANKEWMEKLKKGLMQVLLTGKVRVKT